MTYDCIPSKLIKESKRELCRVMIFVFSFPMYNGCASAHSLFDFFEALSVMDSPSAEEASNLFFEFGDNVEFTTDFSRGFFSRGFSMELPMALLSERGPA